MLGEVDKDDVARFRFGCCCHPNQTRLGRKPRGGFQGGCLIRRPGERYRQVRARSEASPAKGQRGQGSSGYGYGYGCAFQRTTRFWMLGKERNFPSPTWTHFRGTELINCTALSYSCSYGYIYARLDECFPVFLPADCPGPSESCQRSQSVPSDDEAALELCASARTSTAAGLSTLPVPSCITSSNGCPCGAASSWCSANGEWDGAFGRPRKDTAHRPERPWS